MCSARHLQLLYRHAHVLKHRSLVFFRISSDDQLHNLSGKVPHCAQRVFVILRKASHYVLKVDDQVKGLAIDQQMFVLRYEK